MDEPTRIKWPEPFAPQTGTEVIFARMWALESWLRAMAYVELRTLTPRWEEALRRPFGQWPPHSLTADERLSHTTSMRASPLDYLSFGDLWKLLTHPDLAALFKPYLPPWSVLEGRVKEVAQVRHRLAHFRDAHPTDLDRLNLLLRDLDPGIFRFCTTYAEGVHMMDAQRDPVVAALMGEPRFCQFEFQGNLYSPARPMYGPLVLGVSVSRRYRSWVPRSGRRNSAQKGGFYRLHYYAVDGVIEVPALLESVGHLLPSMIHFMIESEANWSISVTIPCCLGTRRVVEIAKDVTSRVHSAVRGRSWQGHLAGRNPIPADAPFNVLAPNNPLVFLCSDMKCAIFG